VPLLDETVELIKGVLGEARLREVFFRSREREQAETGEAAKEQ